MMRSGRSRIVEQPILWVSRYCCLVEILKYGRGIQKAAVSTEISEGTVNCFLLLKSPKQQVLTTEALQVMLGAYALCSKKA